MNIKEEKEITRKNLLRILKELPKLAKKFPYIIEGFYMFEYGVFEGLKKDNLNECCSGGCLLGNSARIFEKEFSDDLFRSRYKIFDYKSFGKKFFPYLYDKSDSKLENIRWRYLFSANWINYPKFNDFDSAIERIKNILDNDLEVPSYDYKTNQIIK